MMVAERYGTPRTRCTPSAALGGHVAALSSSAAPPVRLSSSALRRTRPAPRPTHILFWERHTSTLRGIRTPDLRFRRPTFSPAELSGRGAGRIRTDGLGHMKPAGTTELPYRAMRVRLVTFPGTPWEDRTPAVWLRTIYASTTLTGLVVAVVHDPGLEPGTDCL